MTDPLRLDSQDRRSRLRMSSDLLANAPRATGLNRCRYNEIAELVVAAAQRRALQQRAARQGAMLVPGAAEGAVVKVGGWLADRLFPLLALPLLPTALLLLPACPGT